MSELCKECKGSGLCPTCSGTGMTPNLDQCPCRERNGECGACHGMGEVGSESSVPEAEHFYDILQNASGELLFCVRARNGKLKEPQIVYNGGEHALFYRRPNQIIILDYIHPDTRKALSKVSEVLFAEFAPQNDAEGKPSFDQKGIVREYTATVKQVSELPVDLTGLV